MCVRYTLHKTDAALAAIAKALAKQLAPPEWVKPKYNITLTDVVPAVMASADGPEVRAMMWGMVPPYEQGKPQARMLPNATAEKAAISPAFRQATAKRRCLVPANGFYEWQTLGKLKLPHLFTLKDEEPFAFAGIWESGATDDQPPTFSILTTVPNELVAPIHDRMPVILTQETMRRWIGSEPLPPTEYQALARPLIPWLVGTGDLRRYLGRAPDRCDQVGVVLFLSQDQFGAQSGLAQPALSGTGQRRRRHVRVPVAGQCYGSKRTVFAT